MTYVPVNRRCLRHDGQPKKNYAHEKLAQRQANRLNNQPRGPGKREYFAYECAQCGCWHIGGREREQS